MDRPGTQLDALAEQDGVHRVAVDLSRRAAVQAAFAEVDALPVTPDALVGLAGGFAPGALADVDEENLDAMWRSNFAAALWTAQAVAPRFAERGGGSIVTVGSRPAVTGPGPVAYTTSKAARRPAHDAAGRRAAPPADPRQRRAALDHRHPGHPRVDVGASRWRGPSPPRRSRR